MELGVCKWKMVYVESVLTLLLPRMHHELLNIYTKLHQEHVTHFSTVEMTPHWSADTKLPGAKELKEIHTCQAS